MIHPLQFLFIIQKGQVQNDKLYCLTSSNQPTAYTLAINLFGGISTLTDLNLLQACAIIDNLLREGALLSYGFLWFFEGEYLPDSRGTGRTDYPKRSPRMSTF